MGNRGSLDARGGDYVCLIQRCFIKLTAALVSTDERFATTTPARDSVQKFDRQRTPSSYWLDVQPGPDDLFSLNTHEGHSLHGELLSIGLRSVIVQLSPDSVSFCYLA